MVCHGGTMHFAEGQRGAKRQSSA